MRFSPRQSSAVYFGWQILCWSDANIIYWNVKQARSGNAMNSRNNETAYTIVITRRGNVDVEDDVVITTQNRTEHDNTHFLVDK